MKGRSLRIVVLVLLAALTVVAWLLVRSGKPVRRLYDEAGILRQADAFERTLQATFDESDVDLRIVVAKSLHGLSLEEAAVRRMQQLGIGGKSPEARGVLFLYDMERQQLRIEVGYGLEPYLPDAFVGYLMKDHVRDFFSAGDPTLGFGLTLRIVHHQLRAAALGQGFDPRALAKVRGRRELSGGAGASTAMAIGQNQPGFIRAALDADTRARFVPRSTPDATYDRYLEWLAMPVYDPSVALFTAESRAHLAALPMTRGYFEFILLSEYGRRFKVDARGDLALLYFTNDPLLGPHFFRRRASRWEMDIVAEVRDTHETAGVYVWQYRGTTDDFSKTFADKLVKLKGYVRIAGADNRPLPIRSSR